MAVRWEHPGAHSDHTRSWGEATVVPTWRSHNGGCRSDGTGAASARLQHWSCHWSFPGRQSGGAQTAQAVPGTKQCRGTGLLRLYQQDWDGGGVHHTEVLGLLANFLEKLIANFMPFLNTTNIYQVCVIYHHHVGCWVDSGDPNGWGPYYGELTC